MPFDDPTIDAMDKGFAAVMVTGNSHDYTIAEGHIVYRPYYLREYLARDHVVISFSLGQRVTISDLKCFPSEKAAAIQAQLRNVGLIESGNIDSQPLSEQIIHFFRAIHRILMTPDNDIKYVVIIDYAENLAPQVQTAAAAAESHLFAAETIHDLGLSPALRKSGNFLVCVVRDGLQHPLLNDLPKVSYGFPSQEMVEEFLQIALSKTDPNGDPYYAQLSNGLEIKECARLIRGLPLRYADRMLLEAKSTGSNLTRVDISAGKAKSILDASEGTLTQLSTDLTLDDIFGLKAAKDFLMLVAQLMREGNPAAPRALLFTGPPGTAKTTVAMIIGKEVGGNTVKLGQYENMLYGETERRLKLALEIVPGLEPTIFFIDEITEMISSRSDSNLDSGISKKVLGELFQFTAREENRGKVLTIAASNVPERLDVAWHDRFIIIPFLEPAPEEIRHIIRGKAKLVDRSADIDIDDPEIIQTSNLLHQKGISPRKINDILNHAYIYSNRKSLNPNAILKAALSYTGPANPMAIAYSSLSAIALTSFVEFFPWSKNPSTYLYPWYLEGIVDKETGQINRPELEKRRNEYRRSANL